MKEKSILLLLCVGLFSCSQNEESVPDLPETEMMVNSTSSHELFVAPKENHSVAEQNLREKWKNLATDEFVRNKKYLSKEELQKEMALYILDDCKSILLENGYAQNDFSEKFNDDYQQIILEAMKLYANSTKN